MSPLQKLKVSAKGQGRSRENEKRNWLTYDANSSVIWIHDKKKKLKVRLQHHTQKKEKWAKIMTCLHISSYFK